MHPDEFAKQGLNKDQIKAILRLQADLAEKIAKANYDYCKALKEPILLEVRFGIFRKAGNFYCFRGLF